MALAKPGLDHTIDTIGSSLIDTYHIKTLKDTKEMLFYGKEGIYEAGAEQIIEETVRRQVEKNISKHDMNEIIYYVQTMTYTDRRAFDNETDWLHVANGWINLNSGEFREHSPTFLSLRKLPVEYKVGAVCPAILRFLETTLDHEQMAMVLRMIAYCLLPSSRYETAFILIGEGANGKSTLIKLIKALLGPENCSAVSLQDMASDKFAKADLHGKMVNLFADLKSDRVKEGDFKAIVSGDRIRAQKKYGQPFHFENTAKLIFATNNIPETEDDSYAYFRRWVIIPFNRTFEGENRDVNLLEKVGMAGRQQSFPK